MKTLFIGIQGEQQKTLCRKSALLSYYDDSQNENIEIQFYHDQPEAYFKAMTDNAEIRFYHSPTQPEPYKIEYFWPMVSGAVVMKCDHEKWVMNIWHKLKNPDALRDLTLNTVSDGK